MEHEHIKEAVREAVKEMVNGKIDKLSADFKQYVKEDMAWKDTAQPAIDAFTNLKGTGKIIMALCAFIGTVVGAIIALKTFLAK